MEQYADIPKPTVKALQALVRTPALYDTALDAKTRTTKLYQSVRHAVPALSEDTAAQVVVTTMYWQDEGQPLPHAPVPSPLVRVLDTLVTFPLRWASGGAVLLGMAWWLL